MLRSGRDVNTCSNGTYENESGDSARVDEDGVRQGVRCTKGEAAP